MILDELNLETAPYDKYQIIFHGAIKIKPDSPKYYIEIFLKPYDSQSSIKDFITRLISVEFSRLLVTGAVFGRRNEFIKLVNEKITHLSVDIIASVYITLLKNHPSNEFNPRLVPNSLGLIPLFNRKVWPKNVEYHPENYSFHFLSCFEVIRFFFFCDIKITNSILSGAYINHIGKEARIVKTENGTRIGFVSIKEGYSDHERRVLAWLCLSPLALDAVKEIFLTAHVKTVAKNDSLIFLRTLIPAEALTMKVKERKYAENDRSYFFVNEIVGCNNKFFPVDEIIYTPFVDRRSIQDQEKRDALEEKKYKSIKYVNSPKAGDSDRSLSSEKPSAPRTLGELELDQTFSHFFQLNPIPIKSSKKVDQQFKYKGTCTIINIPGSEHTTNPSTQIDATASQIDSMNKEGDEGQNDFLGFLNMVIMLLLKDYNFSILKEQTFSAYNPISKITIDKKSFVVVEIEVPIGDRYFYLIERVVKDRINRSWILLYSPLFSKINEPTLSVYLDKLADKTFSRESLRSAVKDDKLLISLFYRCENTGPIDADEMSQRIKKLINSKQRRLNL
jgi:hypothetical protein